MVAPIAFYFDFISPYAYLAWTAVHEIAARHGRSVEPIPILFAKLLDHFGHKGPAEIPPKRVYIFKHVLRLAHSMNVLLKAPPAHPFNPLLALRIATADLPELDQRRIIDVLFDAVWAGGPGVTEPDVVAKLLDDAGLDGRKLVTLAGDPEIKARLRVFTEEAITRGVFGVPTIIADGELFWGLDALPHVGDFLAGKDPVPHKELERWKDIPAQAQRPGA